MFVLSLRSFINLLVLCSAVIAIVCDFLGYSDPYSIFKPLTTLLILCIPSMVVSKNATPYSWCIMGGLVFCLVGDILLLDNDFFLYGLASFLVAHIIFLFGFVSMGGWKKYLTPLVILILIGGAYYIVLYDNLGDLAIPVLV